MSLVTMVMRRSLARTPCTGSTSSTSATRTSWRHSSKNDQELCVWGGEGGGGGVGGVNERLRGESESGLKCKAATFEIQILQYSSPQT